MPKKHKRDDTDTNMDADFAEVEPATNQVPTAGPPSSLQSIRDRAIGRQAEHLRANAEAIAELETWRSEIEATIAFLRAQNK